MGLIGEELQQAGISVYTFNFHQPMRLLSQFVLLWKLLKKVQPEVVQTWLYHADFFGGLAARLAGCKHVVWGIRNTNVPHNNRQTYWLMRLCARLSTFIPQKIVCVAEAARQQHVRYGYQENKMAVIGNGFDFTRFDPTQVSTADARRTFKITQDEFIIGCIGRYHLDKGQDVLVAAAATLKPLLAAKNIRFLLVGRSCDTNNENLMRLLNQHELTAYFILAGERYDVPVCLAAMDMYCMPSRTEGFPNGLGEAMAMGLPCLATQAGDTVQLTADSAILVPPNDAQALAHGLEDILNMPVAAQKQLGAHAAQRVRALFSLERTCTQFNTLYQNLREAS